MPLLHTVVCVFIHRTHPSPPLRSVLLLLLFSTSSHAPPDGSYNNITCQWDNVSINVSYTYARPLYCPSSLSLLSVSLSLSLSLRHRPVPFVAPHSLARPSPAGPSSRARSHAVISHYHAERRAAFIRFFSNRLFACVFNRRRSPPTPRSVRPPSISSSSCSRSPRDGRPSVSHGRRRPPPPPCRCSAKRTCRRRRKRTRTSRSRSTTSTTSRTCLARE